MTMGVSRDEGGETKSVGGEDEWGDVRKVSLSGVVGLTPEVCSGLAYWRDFGKAKLRGVMRLNDAERSGLIGQNFESLAESGANAKACAGLAYSDWLVKGVLKEVLRVESETCVGRSSWNRS